MYRNDESMTVKPLTSEDDYVKCGTDIDSIAIIVNKFQGLKCDEFSPFKIDLHGFTSECTNKHVLRELGLNKAKEFRLGGNDRYSIFVILRSQANTVSRSSAGHKMEVIENERDWFMQHVVLHAISLMKDSTKTWRQNWKQREEYVTSRSSDKISFHKKTKIKIYSDDWDEFCRALDSIVTNRQRSSVRHFNISNRYFIYRCVNGLKNENITKMINHINDDLIGNHDDVRQIQIHVAFTVEPYENEAVMVDFQKIRKLVGIPNRQEFYHYKDYGQTAGMMYNGDYKECTWVTTYNPSHHVLRPYTVNSVFWHGIVGGLTALDNETKLAKSDFAKDGLTRLHAYEMYEKCVRRKYIHRIEFVLNYHELTVDHVNRFVDEMKKDLLTSGSLAILGNYSQYSKHLYNLIQELKSLIMNMPKPTDKTFLLKVYNVENCIRFFIEGYKDEVIDTKQLEKMFGDVKKPYSLEGLKQQYDKDFGDMPQKMIVAATFPFPYMAQQTAWIFNNKPTVYHPPSWNYVSSLNLFTDETDFENIPSLQNIGKVVELFSIIGEYARDHCGCNTMIQTFDVTTFFKVKYIDSIKESYLRWVAAITVQEVIDAMTEPRSVIGQLLSSQVFTIQDLKIKKNEIEIKRILNEFIEKHVECIPMIFIVGYEDVKRSATWAEIGKKRIIQFLKVNPKSMHDRSNLEKERTVQSIKSSKNLLLSGRFFKQNNLPSGLTKNIIPWSSVAIDTPTISKYKAQTPRNPRKPLKRLDEDLPRNGSKKIRLQNEKDYESSQHIDQAIDEPEATQIVEKINNPTNDNVIEIIEISDDETETAKRTNPFKTKQRNTTNVSGLAAFDIITESSHAREPLTTHEPEPQTSTYVPIEAPTITRRLNDHEDMLLAYSAFKHIKLKKNRIYDHVKQDCKKILEGRPTSSCMTALLRIANNISFLRKIFDTETKVQQFKRKFGNMK